MIPMKHSSIFKSRWMALLWAAGIIWFAYDTATSAPSAKSSSASASENADRPTDATGAPITPADEQKIAAIINGI